MAERRYELGDAAVRFRGRDRKTTFRQTSKKGYAACDDDVHRDNEHQIVAPTIPIRTRKGCGLTQGVPPYDPAKEAKTQEWR